MSILARPSLFILGIVLGFAAPRMAPPVRASEPDPDRVEARLAEWNSHTRWFRYYLIGTISQDREVAFAFAGRLLERDPHDLLAHMLIARTHLRGFVERAPTVVADSLAIAAILDAGIGREAKGPGDWVERASIHVHRMETSDWRTSINRARDEYRALGREKDARFAVMLRVKSRGGERSPDSMAVDLEEIREIAIATDDPLERADALLIEAQSVLVESYEEAGRLREEARDLLEPYGPSYQLASAWWGIGNVRKRLGDRAAAKEAYVRSREVAREIGARKLEMDAARGEAQILQREGQVLEALALYERIRDYHADAGDERSLCSISLDMRTIYHRAGRYLEARRAAEEALRLARRGPSRRYLGAALDGLASEEAIIGRLESARALYEEALEALDDHGNPGDGIFLRVHLAELYQDLRQEENSARVIRDGLPIAEELGHLRGQLYFRYLESRLALHREDYAEALRLGELLEELGRDSDYFLHRKSFRIRAQALAGMGRLPEAIALLDRSRTEVESVEDGAVDEDERARLLELGSILLSEAGELEEATERARLAAEAAARTGDPMRTSFAGLTWGRCLTLTGRADEGIPLLEEGLAYAERINKGITVGQERAEHLDRWYEDYVALAAGYHGQGRDAEAFDVLERSRARELRRVLRTGAHGLAGKISPEWAARLESVEIELAAVQSTLADEMARVPSERAADLPAIEARVDELERERTEMERELERRFPGLAEEGGVGRTATADQLARVLSPGEIVIATMVGPDATLVFVVDSRGLRVRNVPLGEKDLGETVRALLDDLAEGRLGDEARAAGRRLAQALLADVDAASPPSAIRVLPDGPLHRLPFEVLPFPDPGAEGRERHLLEVAEVSYASSATLLARSREQAREAGGPRGDAPAAASACRLVAFGDPIRRVARGDTSPAERRGGIPTLSPLPYARAEVERLAARVGGACVRVGLEATESAFYAEAPTARILHLAAHAWADDERPEYSSILLAPGPDGIEGPAADGLVQAWEVLRTDIDADLVVLSACETGKGKSLRGEGIIGLARAFRIAGAHSLLVSLWEVGDAATAELMSRFYDRYQAGEPAPAALRGAKLSLMREAAAVAEADGGREAGASPGTRGVGRRPKTVPTGPAVWAPFVLLGVD